MIKHWVLIGLGCILASCGQASTDAPSVTNQTDSVASVAAGGAASAGSRSAAAKPAQNLERSENVAFIDDLDSNGDLGGMVIKIDASVFDETGFMSARGKNAVIVFEDPSCTGCDNIKPYLADAGFAFVSAPVAFYEENGLDLVGALMCETKGVEPASEDCLALMSGMRENTGRLMVQGIVDVPAVLLPNGWMVEGVTSQEDVLNLRQKSDD